MFRNSRWFWLILGCTLLFTSSKTHAGSVDAAFKALGEGKAVAIMRHALAPGFSDPDHFSIDDCQTQRNLSKAGRAQSRVIGELFRSKGIQQAQVLSSEWCRCKETAQLMELGEVVTLSALNSFFENRSAAEAQTDDLMDDLGNWLAAPSKPVVLVTHQVNIRALTQTPTASGEILIITLDDNNVVVLASIATDA